mgnify:CR=1 FL=1
MNEIDRMSTQEQRQPDYALMKQSKYSINMAVSEISLGFAEYLQARLQKFGMVFAIPVQRKQTVRNPLLRLGIFCFLKRAENREAHGHKFGMVFAILE